MEAEAPSCGGDAPAPACPWSGCGLLPLREYKAKTRTVWAGNGSPVPKGREAPYDVSCGGRHHLDFILNVVQSPDIREYFDKGWVAESLYLLAMLDYISWLNGIPLCSDFNDLRELSMKNTIYPEGILIQARVTNNPNLLKEAYDNCIPEFKKANIIENEVRSVA